MTANIKTRTIRCGPPSPRKEQPRGQLVYFISDGEAVKIGFSHSVMQRLKNLQTNHPRPLELLATVPGPWELERELHQKFAHLRVQGEWFRPEPDLMSFIHSLKRTRSVSHAAKESTAKGIKAQLRELREKHKNDEALRERCRTISRNLDLGLMELAAKNVASLGEYLASPQMNHKT